jgi:hydrogenase nickel insertion protein HypA
VQHFRRVRSVFLEIGQLSAVESDAMRFCFDAVIRGTLAEGAVLNVVEVPGEGLCFNCNQTVPLAALYDPCPACGGTRFKRPEAPRCGSRSWKSNNNEETAEMCTTLRLWRRGNPRRG